LRSLPPFDLACRRPLDGRARSLRLAGEVGAGLRVDAAACDRDDVQRAVELAVAAAGSRLIARRPCGLRLIQAVRFGAMNAPPPTFSVVIPAYNTADTLGEAINSVLAQTRQDFEIVVVDDGSSDNTAAVAEGFEDRRIRVYRQENAGPSAARNRGIAEAAGEYVGSLDSDDLWLPDYLAEMARALEENPRADFAYTHAWILDGSGRFRSVPTGAWHKPPTPMLPREQFIAELLQECFVNGPTIRRTALERVGGYDESISHGEDWELWLRLANSGFEGVRVEGPLTIYRTRPGSHSTDRAAMAVAPAMVYRAVLERHQLSPQIRALAEARLRAIDRRTQPGMRFLLGIRGAVGTATRGLRVRYLSSNRWHLRSTPPPRVAEAFPGLGLGEAVSPVGARPVSSSQDRTDEAEIPNGGEGESLRAKPRG
jgi:GT2 family glycosyltransferase